MTACAATVSSCRSGTFWPQHGDVDGDEWPVPARTGAIQLNGDVTVNNIVVDHHDPCTPGHMGATEAPTISHAWVSDTSADAQNINGVAFFNEIEAYNWAVPFNPTTNGALSRTGNLRSM
jgi:hypothetical protein